MSCLHVWEVCSLTFKIKGTMIFSPATIWFAIGQRENAPAMDITHLWNVEEKQQAGFKRWNT